MNYVQSTDRRKITVNLIVIVLQCDCMTILQCCCHTIRNERCCKLLCRWLHLLSQTKKVCTGVRTRQIVIGDNRRARRLFFVVSQLPIFSGTDPHKIMVALAGQLSGWPVSDNTGIATPVSVTTNQSVATPGGDSFKLLSEISSC